MRIEILIGFSIFLFFGCKKKNEKIQVGEAENLFCVAGKWKCTSAVSTNSTDTTEFFKDGKKHVINRFEEINGIYDAEIVLDINSNGTYHYIENIDWDWHDEVRKENYNFINTWSHLHTGLENSHLALKLFYTGSREVYFLKISEVTDDKLVLEGKNNSLFIKYIFEKEDKSCQGNQFTMAELQYPSEIAGNWKLLYGLRSGVGEQYAKYEHDTLHTVQKNAKDPECKNTNVFLWLSILFVLFFFMGI